jgi:glycosyltransferase involved in cell wall biosynthesis
MPNYNHARFLPDALDALLAQSYRPLEFIVVDDASEDSSVPLLQDYARRHPWMRVIVHRENQGAPATLQELLEMAAGDYFFAPAADDLVLPGLLEKSMALIGRHPEAGLCSAQSYTMDEEGRRNGRWVEQPGGRRRGGYYLSPAECAAVCWRSMPWFLGNTVFFQRKAFLGLGGYRPELGSFCDGYMHQALAMSHGACFIPELLASWRRMPTSYANRTMADAGKARQIREAALGLMRGPHSRIFTAEYSRRWERRWNFSSVRTHTVHCAGQLLQGARTLVLPGTISRRMSHAVATLIVRGASASIQFAALCCLIPFDVGRILRRDLWQMVRHGRYSA